jgi:hypothetical protein
LAKDREQIPPFLLNLLGRGHGVGDLLLQEAPVALPKPVNPYFYRPFGQAQTPGNFVVRGVAAASEEGFKGTENLPIARCRLLVLQAGQNVFEQGERPAAFVKCFRILKLRRLQCVSFLR